MHDPFEKMSDRQVKARAHAKNVGAGFNFNKMLHHRVRIDLVNLIIFCLLSINHTFTKMWSMELGL